MIYFDDKGDFRIGKGNCEPKIKDLVKGTPFCHGPCMVKREAYLEVEGYSESKNRMRVEDWDLWVRMYEKGYRGYNLSQPLYKMRDDRDAYNRRKFIYRINEAKVSASVVKKFKLSPINYVWVLRPILVGLLPTPIYKFLHKRKGQIED
jgi:glycosyltransferase EpsE